MVNFIAPAAPGSMLHRLTHRLGGVSGSRPVSVLYILLNKPNYHQSSSVIQATFMLLQMYMDCYDTAGRTAVHFCPRISSASSLTVEASASWDVPDTGCMYPGMYICSIWVGHPSGQTRSLPGAICSTLLHMPQYDAGTCAQHWSCFGSTCLLQIGASEMCAKVTMPSSCLHFARLATTFN